MKKIRIIKVKKKYLTLMVLILIFSVVIIKIKNNQSLNTNSFSFSDEVIVIDPGHGGIDGGTSDSEGYLEKDINLSVALKLKKYLNDNGISVIMTRDKDMSLEKKSNLDASRHLRDLDARKSIINSNDLIKVFVSIHVNSNTSKKPRGIEIYHYPTSGESKYIAEMLKEKIDKVVYNDYLHYEDLRCKIVPENFFILRETNKPGVLVEIGYISNDIDNKLLKNDSYQNKVAKAIGESLIEYLNE